MRNCLRACAARRLLMWTIGPVLRTSIRCWHFSHCVTIRWQIGRNLSTWYLTRARRSSCTQFGWFSSWCTLTSVGFASSLWRTCFSFLQNFLSRIVSRRSFVRKCHSFRVKDFDDVVESFLLCNILLYSLTFIITERNFRFKKFVVLAKSENFYKLGPNLCKHPLFFEADMVEPSWG